MTEITTGWLAWLFDTTPKTIAELAKRELIMSAGAGNWSQASAATSGIFAKWRRGVAATMASKRAQVLARQADLAEAKAAKLRGELVEAKWSSTCRAIRARVLAVADRMRDLPARQHVKLSRELRDALTDLSEGKA